MSYHLLLAWEICWWSYGIFLVYYLSFFPLLLLIFYLCLYFLSVWLLCVSVCPSLCLSCLGLSVLPELSWLFPFPCYRSFQLLSFQIFSQILSPFSFWDPNKANTGAFNVVPELISSSASVVLLLIPSNALITFSKLRSWHLVPSPHVKQMGRQRKQWQTLFWGAPKSLQMVTAAMKLKDAYSLEDKLWPT